MREDGDPEGAGGRVEAWIFLGIGLAVLAIAVLYGTTAGEEAGTAMLVLTAGLGGLAGLYLLRESRRAAEPARVGGDVRSDAEGTPGQLYLPHASIWPLGVGWGLVVVANGLALGAWALVPGALLTAGSVVGYARQSRRRD